MTTPSYSLNVIICSFSKYNRLLGDGAKGFVASRFKISAQHQELYSRQIICQKTDSRPGAWLADSLMGDAEEFRGPVSRLLRPKLSTIRHIFRHFQLSGRALLQTKLFSPPICQQEFRSLGVGGLSHPHPFRHTPAPGIDSQPAL